MKISKLIQRLEEIKAKEGDLDCLDANLSEGLMLNVDCAKYYEDTDVKNLPTKFLIVGEDT